MCFHPTTIRSYTVYRYIMFFPFLFSVENVCPLCHKSFKKNYLMKKHFELIHEGKKSYQCHQCAHLFATKAGLIHHQQHVHEGIKFHCQVCRNNDTISCKESAIFFFQFLHIQGVPSIGTHFRFQFLNFLIVLSQKSNLQF